MQAAFLIQLFIIQLFIIRFYNPSGFNLKTTTAAPKKKLSAKHISRTKFYGRIKFDFLLNEFCVENGFVG